MAVVDTITIGTDTFSVYALVLTEAVANTDTFWNGRLGAEATAWNAATADDQMRALVAAADWLDRALAFTGTKTVSTQPRAWPRDSATNSCTAEAVTDGTVPDDIFKTQAWLAGALLVDTSASASSGVGSNIKKVGAGSANVEFFRPTVGTSSDVRLPQVAHDYSGCYTESAASLSGPTATGTTQTSGFCEDDFGMNEGLA
tara:strand:- start:1822 stop:2424 length:603 start_codon:yes stop_codon:yes gene_type:complete